jgi:fatty acid desaturase
VKALVDGANLVHGARVPRSPRVERKAERIPMSEVRARGYVVVGDAVLDVARFANGHPGGAFLGGLAGKDGTFALANAHGKSARAQRMLRRFYVGPFDETTRDPIDRDAIVLERELRARGFFVYPKRRIVLDVVRWITLFGLGIAVFVLSPWLSFALVLAGTIDAVWWIHDAGHDAIFASEVTARRAIECLGILVLGMPQQGYHYGVHRVHHGFTNVIGLDRALETGPLAWDARTAARKPGIFRRGRLLQWFLGIVPFAGPALIASAFLYCVERRQLGILAMLVVRWTLVVLLAVRTGAYPLLFVPFVAGSVLAFMAGLNHFHLPMSTSTPRSYVRAVFERTQNIEDAGGLWRWLSGGLDLHVEHHLFPMIPSCHYPAVAPFVRAFAERHGLVYRTTSRSGAVLALARALVRPLREPLSTERTEP